MLIAVLLVSGQTQAAYILIPMDTEQKDHLKSYGVAYWVLKQGLEVDWLLNYRGGSFAFKQLEPLEKECSIRGVSYEILPDGQYMKIVNEIADPEVNMDVVKMEKAPKVAVYAPPINQPWDDAVTLVLTYAEIPYEIIYDEDVMSGILPTYDWLHLHHEDFTGQYGKFYGQYRNQAWYQEQVRSSEADALRLGFAKVSQLKLAVAKKINDYVVGGGFLFAMCSATDSYDIALAAEGTDICDHMFDGDAPDPQAQQKLDYSKSFAFQNFKLETNPYQYEFANIDVPVPRTVPPSIDYFTLFEFSAKWDPVPTMLTQCHTRTVKGFMGQTTAFRNENIKSDVLVMGENKSASESRYIHGEHGYGTWTFYGGHDPEDYQHFVGDPQTDLSLHPNSPGYRLILNNILFPAAKKKPQKT
jgi:hypothetical protein